MRRFEFVDGKSSKFWSIALNGAEIDLAWGRIGTDGQSKTKSFGDAEAAKTEHDKLIKAKVKKGYVEAASDSAEETDSAEASNNIPASSDRDESSYDPLNMVHSGAHWDPSQNEYVYEEPGEGEYLLKTTYWRKDKSLCCIAFYLDASKRSYDYTRYHNDGTVSLIDSMRKGQRVGERVFYNCKAPSDELHAFFKQQPDVYKTFAKFKQSMVQGGVKYFDWFGRACDSNGKPLDKTEPEVLPTVRLVRPKDGAFVQLTHKGSAIEVATGKQGKAPDVTTQVFDDVHLAREGYNKILKSKLKAGFEASATEADSDSPNAADEVSGEPRILWDQVTQPFAASRGGQPQPYLAPDADETWTRIATSIEPKHIAGLKAGMTKSSRYGAGLAQKVLDAIQARRVSDVETGAALMALRVPWGGHSEVDTTRWFIATHGLEFALDCALTAASLGARGMSDTYMVFEFSHAATILRIWEANRIEATTASGLLSNFLELRSALAATDDASYAKALKIFEKHLDSLSLSGRVLAAIAFPGEPFTESVEVPDYGENAWYYRFTSWLIPSVVTPERAAAVAKKAVFDGEAWVFATVDRFGPQAHQVLKVLIDRNYTGWHGFLDQLESADVFGLYPALGEEALSHVDVLKRRSDLAKDGLKALADDSRSKYQAGASILLALSGNGEPEPASVAAAKDLPNFLVDPPWDRKVKATKAKYIELEPLPFQDVCHMSADERKQVLSYYPVRDAQKNDAQLIHEIQKSIDRGHWYATDIWRTALIRDWETASEFIYRFRTQMWSASWDNGKQLGPLMVAHWGTHAVQVLDHYGDQDRVSTCAVAQFLESPTLAPLIAESFARLKTARQDAKAWLERYPRAAAIGLIPPAVAKTRKPREFAVRALQHLVACGEADTILSVAKEYGDDALKEMTRLVQTDPFDVVPNKLPKVPGWWTPHGLPRLVHASTGMPLSDEAMNNVERTLAASTLEIQYAGLPVLQSDFTPESLEAFALAAFQAWITFGADNAHYWALYALGWFGRDEAARQLAPMIRRWPGESAAKRATTGLDVLALIGTDVALMHIYAISQKVKYKSIKTRAGELVDEMAAELGLTPAQLGDRLVPDFDLQTDGSTVIDYGTRHFVIRFDESLVPVVFDESGKRLKTLPKPGAKDDEIAAEESKRFKALKKDLKAVASQQLTRLEHAMCSRRRWSPDEFTKFFVSHPLIINLVRRLVWGIYDGDELTQTFRVDEDLSLVDATDEPVALRGRIGIPHTLELPNNAAWGQVFADFEILQPFGQLERATHPITMSEIDMVFGKHVPAPTLVFGLEKLGWRRGWAEDGGAFYYHTREFGDVEVELTYDGAVGMGYINADEPLTPTRLEFRKSGEKIDWSEVDPIVFSETIAELASVVTAL